MKTIKKIQVSAFIAASLDGFIAREDGCLDWLASVHVDGEDYGFTDFFNSADCLLMGRKTYEKIISFDPWPYSKKKLIVVSRSLKQVRDNCELYSGDISELISRLETEGFKHVYIDGGETITTFLKANLGDTLTISKIPVILGSGIPLFGKLDKEILCKLSTQKVFLSSGLVQLSYDLRGAGKSKK